MDHIIETVNRQVTRRSKRLPLMLLAIVGLSTLLAVGCNQPAAAPSSAPGGGTAQETPKPGGILDVAFAIAEPPDIDALRHTSSAYMQLTRKAYNGILQYDPIENTKIIPELAERWEISPDGKTYTFYLHKGVKWHDGVAFTAQDVKYNLDRMRDPKDEFASDLSSKRSSLAPVTQVDVVDDNTLRLTLSRPSNSLLAFLAYGGNQIVPKHAYEQGVDLGKTVLGTGPFKLSDYQRGSVFRMVRNPDYFIKDRPYLDGINIYFLKDDATRVAAFTTGQIKLLSYIYKTQVDNIKKDVPQAVISTKDGLRNGFIGFNVEKPPFTDVRVRQAISLAMDRQAALKVLVPGEGALGTLLSPDLSEFTQEEISKLPGYRADKTQDLAQAKKLLADAGFPNGFKITLLTVTNSQDYQDLAVVAKDQLAKIGIDVTINVVPQAQYTSERTTGNYASMATVGVLNFSDPSAGGSYFGPINFSRWVDSTFQDLLTRQDAEQNPAERKKLVRQMEQRWLDQVPYVMLYWKTHNAAMYPEVRGYEISIGLYNNSLFQDVWLAQ